jgi:hypothetical protein
LVQVSRFVPVGLSAENGSSLPDAVLDDYEDGVNLALG